MKKYLIAFLLSFFICRQLSAQDWILIGSTPQDGDKYYIRNKPAGSSSAKFWIKKKSSKVTVKKKGKVYTYVNGYEIYLYEFDCSENQVKIHSVVTYNLKGTIVDSYDVEEYLKEWKDVVPDSIGEMMLKKACELFE